MFSTNRLASILACLSISSFAPAALAQGLPGWQAGQEAQIQQGAAAGMLSPGQYSHLQYDESKMANQENRWLRQNGGRLTGHEQHVISNEMRNANREMSRDVRHNSYNRYGYGNGGGLLGGLLGGSSYPSYGYTNGVMGTGLVSGLIGSPVVNTMAPAVMAAPAVMPVGTAAPYHHHWWNNTVNPAAGNSWMAHHNWYHN